MSTAPPPPGPPPPPLPDQGGPAGWSWPAWLSMRRLVAGLGAAVVAAFFALYLAAFAAAGSDVPRGTSVLGVDIGGMSDAEAEATLAERLPEVINRTLTVTAGEQSFELDTVEAGLAVDAVATVAQAEDRSLNPGDLFPAFFGAKDTLEPVLAVDEAALMAAVADIAASVDQSARNGQVRFIDGQAVIQREPRPARRLLTEETAQALRLAYESGATTVDAPVEVTPPRVDQAAVDRVMSEFAVPAMSAPVSIALKGSTITWDPARLDDYLQVKMRRGELGWRIDTAAMVADLAEANADLVVPPRDARFRFVKGKPRVVPGKAGERIDAATFAERMRAALVAPAPRQLVADVVVAEPDLTTEAARNLGITEKISSYRTTYPIAEYRVTNIGRAAELIHGSLVLPGEIWSLNETVGERTEANGFVKGFIINRGRFTEELGGGVSQSATTVFNAVFFAGLEDVEHHPHSLYISRYPAGREATVAWGAKDLRFRNNHPTGVLIQTDAGPGYIRVTFWGTKQYDKIESVSSSRYNYKSGDTIRSSDPDCTPQSAVSGFDIDVTRVFYQDGKVVRREKFFTRYQPTDRVICGS